MNNALTTEAAKLHLLELQQQGMGHRRVAEVAGLCEQTVRLIRAGRITKAKPNTIAAILGVKYRPALGVKVNSYNARRLFNALVKEGYTKTEIARRVGLRTPELRLHNRITVRNALRIQALWRKVNEGINDEKITSCSARGRAGLGESAGTDDASHGGE